MADQKICEARWLGEVGYERAWRMQEELAREIAAGACPPQLLLLEHPHTYTLGRRGEAGHLLWDEQTLAEHGVSVHWVDRGGDITYHGPGQLVGYPLLPLAAPGWQGERLLQADYVGYVRNLEKLVIRTLARFGIVSAQRPGLTGVWVPADVFAKCPRCAPEMKGQPAKIASIGVKVDARGISRHGFALNVNPAMEYWDGIVPCGLDGVAMAAMADFVEAPPGTRQVAEACAQEFAELFGYDLADGGLTGS